jgi:diguanylate cyclase (GGDEF)-like protein
MIVRETLADVISGIVDRDSFLQRIAQLVADTSGRPLVAIYTRAHPGGDLALRSSTLQLVSDIPARVSAEQERALDESLEDGCALIAFADSSQAALYIPLLDRDEQAGAVVVFSADGPPFSDSDRETLVAIAGEIAPVIAVAERHHQVKQSSVVDLGTGAYTGWFLNQRLEEEIARAQRSGQTFTVALVTLLDYHALRIDLGYERSDGLLRDLANELSATTRVFDVVARKAPGEFAVLLPDTNRDGAGVVVERVRGRVARVIERFNATDDAIPIRVAAGAAAYPLDGDRATTLLMAAEQRLDEDGSLQRRAPGPP